MATVFEITDKYVDELAEIFPTLATSLGVPGHDHEWGHSLSLEGVEMAHELGKRYRDLLTPHLEDPDPRQRLAAEVTVGSIDEGASAYLEGDHFRDLRHLASPFHQMRQVFDLMPAASKEDWENIRARLSTIDVAYHGYRDRLAAGMAGGIQTARRQVRSVIEQAQMLASDDSAFNRLLGRAESSGHLDDGLTDAVGHARVAAGDFGLWLEESYLPTAPVEDATGEDVYRRSADRLVGLRLDTDEAYQWGWDELRRLLDEMEKTAERISPGASVEEVREFLENDPDELAKSPEELVAYVEGLLAQAADDLAGSHFEVPDIIRPLTVQIAPPGGPLSAYYMRPSEDFSRPGGVWYSIGDQTQFPLYQHTSTAYHEGFPGHHLQIATAMYRRDQLSRTQRSLTWYPGYGEGWGMYAEVLMGELGYLEDPKHYFGMLAKQMYRAARVVVDIGLHLEKRLPGSSPMAPNYPWGFEVAVEFMQRYGFQSPPEAEAEVLRYLGWPGQAIAYKLGEREILSIREETRRRLGDGFDLRDFHGAVLNHGPMRLDTLRGVVGRALG